MEITNSYYKHSNTGNIIHHVIGWWLPGSWVKSQKEAVKYCDYYYSPMTDTKSIAGSPDLTGYVPVSEKHYNRLVLKLQRAKRRESSSKSIIKSNSK